MDLLEKLIAAVRPEDAGVVLGIGIVLLFLWRVIDRVMRHALEASKNSGPQVTEILVQTRLMSETLERVSETLRESSTSFRETSEATRDTLQQFAGELVRVNERLLRLESEFNERMARVESAASRAGARDFSG